MEFSPKGIFTAVVTPATKSGDFDETAFRRLIDFQIDAGIAGLLVVGGSGEYISLTMSERKRVIDISIEHVAGRVPIIVGALSPSTKEVKEIAQYASRANASAVLVLPPFYIKPSSDGVFQHFAEVASCAPMKIVAYNNAGRTGLALDVTMLERLSAIPSIVALKECERDLAVVSLKINAVGSRIAILAGDDDLAFPALVLGCPGAILMSSNLVPAFHVNMLAEIQRGNIDLARRAHYAVLPLIEALYTPNHPGPLKEAMSRSGLQVGPPRIPLQGGNPEDLRRAELALHRLAEFRFN